MIARSNDPDAAAPRAAGPWLDDVGAIAVELRRLFEIQVDRARTRSRRRIAHALILAPLLLAAASAAVSAGWFAVAGLAALLRDQFGAPPWLAQSGAGAAVLLSFALSLGLWLRLAESREMRRLEKKYADPRREPEARPEPRASAPAQF